MNSGLLVLLSSLGLYNYHRWRVVGSNCQRTSIDRCTLKSFVTYVGANIEFRSSLKVLLLIMLPQELARVLARDKTVWRFSVPHLEALQIVRINLLFRSIEQIRTQGNPSPFVKS